MTTSAMGRFRILDLSSHISGPFAAKLFGDYGADVIKIETPGHGDISRRTGPFYHDDPHPEKSLTYLYVNTNKRGVTLDIENSLGRSIFLRLIEKSDAVIESFAPGYLDSLDLGYEVLKKIKPGLVMTSITPFGQTGPYRDYVGNDLVYQAMSGIMYTSGAYDREPIKHGHPQTLWMGGIISSYATSAALLLASTTGEGQQIDLSMAEVAASHHYSSPIRYIYSGVIERRAPKNDRGSTKGVHFEGIVPAKDGYFGPSFQLGRGRRPPLSDYAELLERPDIAEPGVETPSLQGELPKELDDKLLSVLKEWNKFDHFNKAMSAGWVTAVVQTSEDLVNCPQLAERDFYTEVEHPVIGKINMPGEVFRLPKSPWSMRFPAPLLGQHNNAIYCDELGYSKNDLVMLRQQGVI
jgi:CoA:oxalate CoA-transferase